MDEPEEEADERPICAACGYYNLPTAIYQGDRLCRLCSTTLTGNALRHPNLYPEAKTMFTVCFVGNAILDQLGAFDAWKAENPLLKDEDL